MGKILDFIEYQKNIITDIPKKVFKIKLVKELNDSLNHIIKYKIIEQTSFKNVNYKEHSLMIDHILKNQERYILSLKTLLGEFTTPIKRFYYDKEINDLMIVVGVSKKPLAFNFLSTGERDIIYLTFLKDYYGEDPFNILIFDLYLHSNCYYRVAYMLSQIKAKSVFHVNNLTALEFLKNKEEFKNKIIIDERIN